MSSLLIIVLCLFSERYLVHITSFNRFYWFNAYLTAINARFSKTSLENSYGMGLLLLATMPILFVVWLLHTLLGWLFFGLVGFLIKLVVFYYCLGPDNPFYPFVSDDESEVEVAANYFVKANNQLFAVIFWFIAGGYLWALFYRLVSLCMNSPAKNAAHIIIILLDWFPVRISLFFYLLVGSFQDGFAYLKKMFLTRAIYNDEILSKGGLLAAGFKDKAFVSLTLAQNLVENGLILYLVFIALLTLSRGF